MSGVLVLREMREAVALAAFLALAALPAERAGAQEGADAAAPGAAVAEAPADTLVLTLRDALDVARGSNPTVRRARNSLGLNAWDTRATWANQVLPQASLTLFSTGYNGNIATRATDNFGNPIENPQSEWVYFSNTRQSLNLSWDIQGANLLNALARQEQTNRGRFLEEDRALNQVEAEVRRLYYDVLEQRELLDAELALAEAARIDLETAERLFRLARETRVGVLNAELEIEQQALAVEQQRAAYERARLQLRSALGDPDLPAIRLEAEPLPDVDPAALDPDALVRRAEGASPELLLAESGVRDARLDAKQSRNEWWPSLRLGYNVTRLAQTPETEALFDVSYDETYDQNFFVQLTFPFFQNPFENLRSIEEAEVQLDNEQESLREARLQVEQEIRSQLIELRNAREQVRLNERALAIAEEALRLAREEYRLGTVDFRDLQTTIQEEATTRRELIQARYALAEALFTLEEQVGEPIGGRPETPR